MLKRIPPQKYPELKNPGDPEAGRCAPGSIEQKLDMCEDEGSLRGDDVQFQHGEEETPPDDRPDSDPHELTEEMLLTFRSDISEADREGDEMSGDEHSGGLQGDASELESNPEIDAGIPGEATLRERSRGRKKLRS